MQRTDVKVVQPAVEHWETPMLALTVASTTAKFTPLRVSSAPEPGVLYALAPVKTGASYVKPIIPAVPTSELTVNTMVNDEPVPAGTAQRTADIEVHETLLQAVEPRPALSVGS